MSVQSRLHVRNVVKKASEVLLPAIALPHSDRTIPCSDLRLHDVCTRIRRSEKEDKQNCVLDNEVPD